MSAENKDQLTTCISCGNEHLGLYCNQCGERVLLPREKTLVYYLQELFNAFTFADTKLLRSIRLIVLNPGAYSSDIAIGKKVKLMRPVNLFLLCNLIYFLFPVLDTFNTPLVTQMRHLPSSELFHVEERVMTHLEESELLLEDFRLVYEEKSSSNAKLLLILLNVFFAIGFSILAFRRKRYFVDHLVFAFEYGIFILFVNTIAFGYLLWAVVFALRAFGAEVATISEFYLSVVVATTSLYFLLRGVRTYYQFPWIYTVAFSLLCFLWSFAALQCYRWILFEVTFFNMQ